MTVLAAFCACGQSKGALTGILAWENATETVVLGDCYDTTLVVAKDDSGNEYPVSVKVVRRESGKQVPLIGGLFDISDVGGYEIYYTASTDDAEATKKVVLNVKDETVTLEIGADRTKLEFQKWAIKTVTKPE